MCFTYRTYGTHRHSHYEREEWKEGVTKTDRERGRETEIGVAVFSERKEGWRR